jgi:predicted amidohydrolase
LVVIASFGQPTALLRFESEIQLEHFGLRCGALICHDYGYPELYREYKKRGVQLMFHSYHAADTGAEELEKMLDYVGREQRYFGPAGTLPAITMPAGMIASASNNYVWISRPNSSAKESCWPSFFVRPDGAGIFSRISLIARGPFFAFCFDPSRLSVKTALGPFSVAT